MINKRLSRRSPINLLKLLNLASLRNTDLFKRQRISRHNSIPKCGEFNPSLIFTSSLAQMKFQKPKLDKRRARAVGSTGNCIVVDSSSSAAFLKAERFKRSTVSLNCNTHLRNQSAASRAHRFCGRTKGDIRPTRALANFLPPCALHVAALGRLKLPAVNLNYAPCIIPSAHAFCEPSIALKLDRGTKRQRQSTSSCVLQSLLLAADLLSGLVGWMNACERASERPFFEAVDLGAVALSRLADTHV